MSATEREEAVLSATADREIVISRVIDAPREMVFEAFTEVRHLSRWWGPEGFTTTTRSFEFRVGGEWDFVMHGPDGTDYQEWICWTEITPPARIALLHGESRGDPNAFESVLTFEPEGAATRVEMRAVFPTKALRDEAAEQYHAIEAGHEVPPGIDFQESVVRWHLVQESPSESTVHGSLQLLAAGRRSPDRSRRRFRAAAHRGSSQQAGARSRGPADCRQGVAGLNPRGKAGVLGRSPIGSGRPCAGHA